MDRGSTPTVFPPGHKGVDMTTHTTRRLALSLHEETVASYRRAVTWSALRRSIKPLREDVRRCVILRSIEAATST